MKKEIESALENGMCQFCEHKEVAEDICWIFDRYIDNKIKFFEELKTQQSKEEQLLFLPIMMLLSDLKKGVWNDES